MIMDSKSITIIACVLMFGVAFSFNTSILGSLLDRSTSTQNVSFEQMATMYIRP